MLNNNFMKQPTANSQQRIFNFKKKKVKKGYSGITLAQTHVNLKS